MEAKYKSMTMTSCELTWLCYLLFDLGIHHNEPMTLYCDNKVVIHIVVNLIFHESTKHIELDCHLVREKIHQGLDSHYYSSMCRYCYLSMRQRSISISRWQVGCSQRSHSTLRGSVMIQWMNQSTNSKFVFKIFVLYLKFCIFVIIMIPQIMEFKSVTLISTIMGFTWLCTSIYHPPILYSRFKKYIIHPFYSVWCPRWSMAEPHRGRGVVAPPPPSNSKEKKVM